MMGKLVVVLLLMMNRVLLLVTTSTRGANNIWMMEIVVAAITTATATGSAERLLLRASYSLTNVSTKIYARLLQAFVDRVMLVLVTRTMLLRLVMMMLLVVVMVVVATIEVMIVMVAIIVARTVERVETATILFETILAMCLIETQGMIANLHLLREGSFKIVSSIEPNEAETSAGAIFISYD